MNSDCTAHCSYLLTGRKHAQCRAYEHAWLLVTAWRACASKAGLRCMPVVHIPL